MSSQLIFPLVVVFVAVAVAVGAMINLVLSGTAPERRRLRQLGAEGGGGTGLILDTPMLTDSLTPAAKRAASLIPASPTDLSELRRRLTMAGYRDPSAAIWFSLARVVMPIGLGLIA